jgi:hypothetical protein
MKIEPKLPTIGKRCDRSSSVVSDDEETLELDDIHTPIDLINCVVRYMEYKWLRQLAREYAIRKSSLQDKIKVAKSKSLKAQARQNLTVLEKLVLEGLVLALGSLDIAFKDRGIMSNDHIYARCKGRLSAMGTELAWALLTNI